MKKFFALFAAAVIAASACFAADPVEGYWESYDEKTGQKTASWLVYVEDGKVFGKIIAVAGQPQDVKATGCKGKGPYSDFPEKGTMSEMTSVGTRWIYNLIKQSEGVWAKGKVVDPNDGNRYACRMTFHASDGKKYKTDTLEMRGEIGIFGRSQYWQRVTKEEAESLR